MTEPDNALVVYEPQPIALDDVDEPLEDEVQTLAVIVSATIDLSDDAITFTVEDGP